MKREEEGILFGCLQQSGSVEPYSYICHLMMSGNWS